MQHQKAIPLKSSLEFVFFPNTLAGLILLAGLPLFFISCSIIFFSTTKTISFYLVTAGIIAGSLDAIHVVSAWWVLYYNKKVWNAFKLNIKTHIFWFLTYSTIILTTSLYFWNTNNLYTKGLLFLIIFGPVGAHHLVAQDRGILAFFSLKNKNQNFYFFLKKFYIPTLYLVTVATMSPPLTKLLHFNNGTEWLKILSFVGIAALLFLSLYIYKKMMNEAGGTELGRASYLTVIFLQNLALVFSFFNTNFFMISRLIHSLRHYSVYSLVCKKYLENNGSSIGKYFLMFTLPIASVVAIPVTTSFLTLDDNGLAFLKSIFPEPILMNLINISFTIYAIAALNHIHIDRISWKLRAPEVREEWCKHLLG